MKGLSLQRGNELQRQKKLRPLSLAQLNYSAWDRTVIQRQQEGITSGRQAGSLPIELEAVIVLLQAITGEIRINGKALLARYAGGIRRNLDCSNGRRRHDEAALRVLQTPLDVDG